MNKNAVAEDRAFHPLRWGYVIALALPLIILNGWWIANSEMKTGVTEVTISTLFMGVTFVLFMNHSAEPSGKACREWCGTQSAGVDGTVYHVVALVGGFGSRALRVLRSVSLKCLSLREYRE